MTPILFVDRDGTLIEEPADFQIDAYEKLRFVQGVIPAMLKLRDAGYQFVIVTNQDGLGSEAFPQAAFDGPHDLMLQIFASQGIAFREVLIDCSWPADNAPTRKPGIGLMLTYLQDRSIDWARSAMVGDRLTDVQFAENLRIRGFQLKTEQFGGDWDWAGIAHELADAPRRARVQRDTKETRIAVEIDLDLARDPHCATGLPFFDHMLEQIGKHGGFALDVRAEGDLHIDEHHTIEDTGLALGQALRQALGDKRGIGRYGFDPPDSPWLAAGGDGRLDFTLPMDETLASAALDFSGRPYFVFEGEFKRERVGDLPTELVPHFFRSLCDASGLNLHLRVHGDNDHHKVEACFKALARALRQALRREGAALPSTKGVL
ncbi:bifunctional histidinol-phosphatase/imidazoleglycerol-phosphate dehydratase HisB [Xanthomonas translucens]|uniref:bifunctional histidinol-phosphatase/imidazoleglycerol-phosphate dehydratase HisB n=1 Tax=Xanthomonas campestris pv. translucens TaxID=343 RepID=UPI000641E31A|nr:bifunctional histidinol-phosphatase/imidazoleglycerol-phosphate dehydratase HisB [Xanthomonas translucens]AKK67384.1 imidazoleglycerol-phosphate dehydratase [Xanthomonas translucens pv. undulosa]MCT8271849.1 bifunctional histidinol-phosphatase/imidazoleglycerol-phosphate dehydratase HisB [Xanthomonas translucens pv. undulosa]WNJ30741.1 bifunctional histidinol-phosphatase/imidazoleglycerol-phosphate dehydratase HisB [Xanthomonas translucens pv. undulosa]